MKCPDCGSPMEAEGWWDDEEENGGCCIGTVWVCIFDCDNGVQYE